MLSARDRYLILTAAFLGWLFSGVPMNVMYLCAGSATIEFLRSGQLGPETRIDPARLFVPSPAPQEPISSEQLAELAKSQRPYWASLFNAIFLMGAAAGGFVFGSLGDRFGRVRAMAGSILCLSVFTGLGYAVQTPEQMLLLRLLAGMGIGGMWPTGVALAAEAWSDVSRPTLAGLLGMSANIGIVGMSVLGYFVNITPDSWRWMLLVGWVPTLLAILVLLFVPESPQWLADRQRQRDGTQSAEPRPSVFQPPLLWRTLIGIGLGTIPMLGGWAVTGWTILWADAVHHVTDPKAKAAVAIFRGVGGTLGSFLGGWLAAGLGRRRTYFVVSLITFLVCEYIFLALEPQDPTFTAWVFVAGFVSTIFFGWMPLYLPELFPTYARATGAGVSFNFGRILSAMGVLGTGAVVAAFGGNYAWAGTLFSFIYASGMVIILFAPDTKQELQKASAAK